MIPPQQMVDDALTASSADACVVIAADHTEANLRWANNSLTTNGRMHSRSVTVVSIFDDAAGARAGVVSRAVTTPEELTALVRASERAGRDAAPADDAMPLVDAYEVDDDWSAEPRTTGIEVFENFAGDLGGVLAAWRRDDRALFGFAEHQMTSTFLGTSTGLRRRFDQPDGRIEVNGKSGDYSRSAWFGAHSENFADIDVVRIGEELDVRLAWAANRVELPPGRYETILPPTAVADLMIYAYWTASARDAEEGRSVFAAGDGGTRVGEQLATLPLTLRSDPGQAEVRCPPFEIATESAAGLQSVFDNGAAVDPAVWLHDGTLTELARTRSWAARTQSAPRLLVGNLILEQDGVHTSIDDMVATTERGLLLTCLWYIREVDPQTLLLTGLTRDGVYLIENGAVVGAVNNFRFNESPVDLLRRASEASRSEHTMSREWSDYFRRTMMPALRIPDFNMSTVSQAS